MSQEPISDETLRRMRMCVAEAGYPEQAIVGRHPDRPHVFIFNSVLAPVEVVWRASCLADDGTQGDGYWCLACAETYYTVPTPRRPPCLATSTFVEDCGVVR